MPIRMLYQPNSIETGVEIDVYHFHQLEETLDCFVTGWVVNEGYWITTPIHTLKPIDTLKKKLPLNE